MIAKMCCASYYCGRIKNIDVKKIEAAQIVMYTTAGWTYLWPLLFRIDLSSNISSSKYNILKDKWTFCKISFLVCIYKVQKGLLKDCAICPIFSVSTFFCALIALQQMREIVWKHLPISLKSIYDLIFITLCRKNKIKIFSVYSEY